MTESIAHQLGRVAGVLDQITVRIGGIEREITSLREANAKDHASVRREIAQLREDFNAGLASRVSQEAYEELERRVDALEAERDARQGERRGMSTLAKVGVTVASLALSVAAFFAGQQIGG